MYNTIDNLCNTRQTIARPDVRLIDLWKSTRNPRDKQKGKNWNL